MHESSVTRAISIDELVTDLRALPESAFRELEHVRELLRSKPVNPSTLEPFLAWDRQHYTRNLIEKTEVFELMAICWEAGQASSIHNHRDENCWMAVPIGRLIVQNYRVLFKDLANHRCRIEPTDQLEMNAVQPCAVDPAEPVHSVMNPRAWRQRAVSLHVYSRPFDSCEVYSLEQGTCGDIQLHYTTVKGRSVER
jgi:cysteine dioxygenase